MDDVTIARWVFDFMLVSSIWAFMITGTVGLGAWFGKLKIEM